MQLPVVDGAGNELVDLVLAGTASLQGVDPAVPLPLSLVVVRHREAVLLVFDTWKGHWELPGGAIEPGESPVEAAIRELLEETGIHADHLDLCARAEFLLGRQRRREYAAVHAMTVARPPALSGDDEIGGFRWWDPRELVPPSVSPLDGEIARACLGSLPRRAPASERSR